MPLCGSSACGCRFASDGSVTIGGAGTATSPFLFGANFPVKPWVPVLDATISTPSLGSGSNFLQEGWYQEVGQVVTLWGFIRWGESGSAGNSTYYVSLPVAAAAGTPPAVRMIANTTGGRGQSIGGFNGRNGAAGQALTGELELRTESTAWLVIQNLSAAGEASYITNAVPDAWGTDADVINYWGSYIKAA